MRVQGLGDDDVSADVWSEDLELTGAQAVATVLDGPAAGLPAVTRHGVGDGAAWYVATRLDPEGTDHLVRRVVAEAGVEQLPGAGPDVEVTRRVSEGTEERSWLFIINHGTGDATVPVRGTELVSGHTLREDLVVPGGGVAVVREEGS